MTDFATALGLFLSKFLRVGITHFPAKVTCHCDISSPRAVFFVFRGCLERWSVARRCFLRRFYSALRQVYPVFGAKVSLIFIYLFIFFFSKDQCDPLKKAPFISVTVCEQRCYNHKCVKCRSVTELPSQNCSVI